MTIMHLRLDDFLRGAPFHVAMAAAPRLRSPLLHDHDFHEIFYVIDGLVSHERRDRTDILRSGCLVLVRPCDAHTLRTRSGTPAQIANVAFSSELWRSYCALIGADSDRPWASFLPGPPTIGLAASAMVACSAAFDQILDDALGQPSTVHLFAFWCRIFLSAALGESMPERGEGGDRSAPEWLRTACRELRAPENLIAGVPRLVEISGVSGEHLSRTMRTAMDTTPTAFVNEQRLRRAAALLVSTPAAIAQVALDCGYDNLSYFHRQFRARFATTPRAYRTAHKRPLAP